MTHNILKEVKIVNQLVERAESAKISMILRSAVFLGVSLHRHLHSSSSSLWNLLCKSSYPSVKSES